MMFLKLSFKRSTGHKISLVKESNVFQVVTHITDVKLLIKKLSWRKISCEKIFWILLQSGSINVNCKHLETQTTMCWVTAPATLTFFLNFFYQDTKTSWNISKAIHTIVLKPWQRMQRLYLKKEKWKLWETVNLQSSWMQLVFNKKTRLSKVSFRCKITK